MTRDEFISRISINGVLSPARCKEPYLKKNGLYDWLVSNTSPEFETTKDKIHHLVYGGGYCLVCNCRTKIHPMGRGFAKYCKEHFHEPKRGKLAHNRKYIDKELIYDLYVNQKKPFLEIAKITGIGNVTLKKKFLEYGFEMRSHAETQSMRSTTKGKYNPRIKIDREELVRRYRDEKIPSRILAEEYGCDTFTIARFLAQEGVDRVHKRSYIEHKIHNIVDEFGIKRIINKRTYMGNGLEIDVFLPEHNIGIEVNGIWAHSYYSGKKHRKYHYNKFKDAESNGITLLQFWEDDINEKLDIVKSMISSRCGIVNYRYYARKCTLRDVSNRELSSFCTENHIQGAPSRGTRGIGLFYNEELVSTIGYTITKDKTTINRFCSKLNTSVVGGFTKLLKRVPGSIIVTYSSNDISNGNLYAKSGFINTKEHTSDMWYTDYKKILNRQKYMKKNLPHILEDYDEDKTEVENMIQNGYDVIYKSGTKTWVLCRK